MIVKIRDSVLNNDKWYPLLDVITELLFSTESRHAFDARDVTHFERSAWLKSANGSRGSLSTLLKGSIRSSSRVALSDAVTVRLDDSAPRTGIVNSDRVIDVHPLGGLFFLAQPFQLIVEDETSDGGFFLWMARLCGREELIRAYRSGSLIFRHAGGKGQLVKSASAITNGIWPQERRPLRAMKFRCAAMLDSDARFPLDRPNEEHVSGTREHVAFVHMLSGRTIENYVPEKYMRRRLQADKIEGWADSYFQLSEAQRAYFPIKKGYVKDGSFTPLTHAEFLRDPKREPAEKAHYQNANPTSWAVVAGGLGDRLASIFTEPSYRCDRADHRHLTPSQRTELNDLLTSVFRHL
jgi:hypothetical protein